MSIPHKTAVLTHKLAELAISLPSFKLKKVVLIAIVAVDRNFANLLFRQGNIRLNPWHIGTQQTHFGHENVMTIYDRPFASVEEMDTTLRAHMKDRVGQDEADLEIALGHNRASCRASGRRSQASQYALPLSQ